MCVRILAARCARALCRFPPSKNRGRRKGRVRAAPAVSCASLHKEMRTRAYRFGGGIPAFPAQWFTAYFVLFLVTGFLATIARGTTPVNLTPAWGRQNHTTSPSASCAFVCCACRVHRIPPHVRDDREPPLLSGETRGVMPVIWPTGPAEYFCAGGWTGFFDLSVGSIYPVIPGQPAGLSPESIGPHNLQ
jgi:hypothetical protein